MGPKTFPRNLPFIGKDRKPACGEQVPSSLKGAGGERKQGISGLRHELLRSLAAWKTHGWFLFSAPRNAWNHSGKEAPLAGRALTRPGMQTLRCLQREAPGQLRCSLPGVPGRQLGPQGCTFGRNRGLEGGSRNLGVTASWAASWREKGERARGSPGKRSASESKASPGQAQQGTKGNGRRADRSCTVPAESSCPALQAALGCTIVSMALRFAVTTTPGWPGAGQGCRLEARNGFSSRPSSQHIFEGLPRPGLRTVPLGLKSTGQSEARKAWHRGADQGPAGASPHCSLCPPDCHPTENQQDIRGPRHCYF